MRRSTALAIPPLILLACCGCELDSRHMLASVASASKPYAEYAVDPVGLVAIRTIAILPFDDRTRDGTFDAQEFALRFANQLASLGVFRVLYPGDVLGDVEAVNRSVQRHNDRLRHFARYGMTPENDEGEEAAPAPVSAPREPWDPVRREEQALKLARKAGADAVIVGYATEADPYMRPRVSITLRMLATGRSENAAAAIAQLAQWGVPRPHANAGGAGLILTRQQNYDAREGNIGRDVSLYGRTHHIDNHANDSGAYLRSSRLYYDIVGLDLAKAMAQDRNRAVKESRRRAKAAAKANRQSEADAESRLDRIIERDERIPDFEDAEHGPAYFDQAFPDERLALAHANDRRIRSFRPNGGGIRRAAPEERAGRDNRPAESGDALLALGGFAPPSESGYPDAEQLSSAASMDRRDRSWRPDVHHAANPSKALPLYDPSERGLAPYD